MLVKSTLKSSRLYNFRSLPALCRSFFRFAARCGGDNKFPTVFRFSLSAAFIISSSAVIYPQARNSLVEGTASVQNSRSTGQLIEQVPKPFLKRYNRWKEFLLATETGRRLWLRFAENPAFKLTIIVSKSRKNGGIVDNYRWDGGKLVGATITLGHHLNYGYPSHYKYPVLGSLALISKEDDSESDDILAAAKFAHELGHVEHAASDPTRFKLQNELSKIFFERFSLNGFTATDPVLQELEQRMGGVPTKIAEERENRAEVFVLYYLMDKLGEKKVRKLMKAVQKSVKPEFKYLFT